MMIVQEGDEIHKDAVNGDKEEFQGDFKKLGDDKDGDDDIKL